MARPPKQRPANPISTAVKTWLAAHRAEIANQAGLSDEDLANLVPETPKRWVHYEPMILLPSGSFTSTSWKTVLDKLPADVVEDLWSTMLRCVGQKCPGAATHLAVNDGIPLEMDQPGQENILRSPVGLRILYGDFGPSALFGSSGVTARDFGEAFWASARQNGIFQTWAPRWTMFSRGNVKEKARLLGFHDEVASLAEKEDATTSSQSRRAAATALLQHRARPRAALKNTTWAVDLYAGIGYFVFSYAKLGMRVLCWELNPWSVEGLRRGALANGWSVKVVQGEALQRPMSEILLAEDKARITVFLENNQQAAGRIRELRSHGGGLALPMSHVNCGLLPRSDDSWQAAREILGVSSSGGWLHLHENVGFRDIEQRRGEIQTLFDSWDKLEQQDGGGRIAKVEHVELVKTFAPDVWHCVFDVYITTSNIENKSP